MPEVTAVHKYAGAAKEIARRIKNPVDDDALQQAAHEMAPFVPEGAILILAPSSTGLNQAMKILAQYIAALVEGARVVEAVRRVKPVPSSMMLRRAGRRAVSISEHVDSMGRLEQVPPGGPLVVIDNVVTQRNTIKAMEQILGKPLKAVVYADAARAVKHNPYDPITPRVPRICIAGSRGFAYLDLVDEVVWGLPIDAILCHGGALGVDQRAAQAATRRGLTVEEFRPNWAQHGRAAGPIRNREMIETCDALIAFWDGESRGTADAIRLALALDKELEVVLDQ